MGQFAFVVSVIRIFGAIALILLSPAVALAPVPAGWVAYMLLLFVAVFFLVFFFIGVVKIFELGIRVVGNVPFEESRSTRAGGILAAIRRFDRTGNGNWRKSTQSTMRRRSVAPSRASQRPRTDASSPASGQPMLGNRASSRWSTATGSYSDATSYRSPHSPSGFPPTTLPGPDPSPSAEEIDDGYIMSAWQRVPGYVAPGSYSAVPATPSHRHSASWGESTRPQGSSFVMVRGGKASENSPYSIEQHHDYPPAHRHLGSSGYHSANSSTPSLGSRPRARSQSATIEFAQEVAAAIAGPSSKTHSEQRPGTAGTVELYPKPVALPDQGPSIPPAASKKQPRFLARLVGKSRKSTDFSSDDDDDETADEDGQGARRGGGGFWFLGKKQKQKDTAGDKEQQSGGGKSSFVVVRQPRPKPRTSPTLSNSKSEEVSETVAAAEPTTPKTLATPPDLHEQVSESAAEAGPSLSVKVGDGPGTRGPSPLPPGAAPPMASGSPERSPKIPRPTSSKGTIVNEPPRLPDLDF
jgi:hypothetical protein